MGACRGHAVTGVAKLELRILRGQGRLLPLGALMTAGMGLDTLMLKPRCSLPNVQGRCHATPPGGVSR